MKIDLRHGDCLELMKDIPDGSVDLILCDLPYGTTACKWDSVIPFEPMWTEYKRIAKLNAAIVLTASQPFTTALIYSNMAMFKYCWVWDKGVSAGAFNARYQPLKTHEDIVVFSSAASTFSKKGTMKYAPQMNAASRKIANIKSGASIADHSKDYQRPYDNQGLAYPKSVLPISNRSEVRKLHPTQKPVALMEYLIRTYTNEGDTALDNCMGSGTTGVACVNTGRNFIGMEMDAGYFEIAKNRIEAAQK